MVKRSLRASETGVEKARLELTDKAWSQEKLAEHIGIGRQTANKFFACKPIGRTTFVQICQILNINWYEVADLSEEDYIIEPTESTEPCKKYEIDVLVQQVCNKVKFAIQDRCGTIRVLDMVQPVDLNDIYTDVNVLERISGQRRIEISELFRKLQKPREIKNFDNHFVKENLSDETDTSEYSENEETDLNILIPGSYLKGSFRHNKISQAQQNQRPYIIKDIEGFSEPGEIQEPQLVMNLEATFQSVFGKSDLIQQALLADMRDKVTESEESEIHDGWDDDIERFGLGLITEERVSAKDVVSRYPRLMLLGKPGAGKTTFLKYLAIQCINSELISKKIPIFITLKDFAEAENKVSLLDFIQNYFLNYEVNKEQFIELLKHGRFLLLLDGLDEVREEDAERITNQIKEFSSNYFYSNEFKIDSHKHPDKSIVELCKEYPNKIYTNSFVLTCRIAANEYTFENFTEVEVADFNDAQIKKFAQNWFNARDPKRLNRFIQKLDDNKPIKELGNNPLLLTLLCLVFEDSGDFPRNRAELYQEGLDIMLKKWDAKRNIQRDQIYKNLSIKRKEDLLSEIALITFERKDYFFRKKDAEEYISNYISNLPDAETDPQALLVDSEAILKSIEAQHGLLVERAKEIYSFSHLTFQEYFSARKLTTTSEPQKLEKALQSLAGHVAEKRWREVLLLAVGILPSVNRLLILMTEEVDKLVIREEKILEFLKWVNRKSSSVESNHKLFEIRDFYIRLDSILDFGEELMNSSEKQKLLQALVDELIEDSPGSLAVYPIKLNALDCILDNTLKSSLNHTIKLAYASEPSLNIGSNLIEALDLSIKSTQDKLLRSDLRSFKKKIPDPYSNRSGFQALWRNNGKSWVKQLRRILKKYRNIANVWKFNEQEKKLLKRYYDANRLLIECLKDSYVTRSVRMEIENHLLNPKLGIENYFIES